MQLESKILCEEFRQEAGGKYILLGVYRTLSVANNIPKENRWKEPMRWCFFAGVNLNRTHDAGHYIVKAESNSGTSLMPGIPLEIRAEGDDFVQLPIKILMDMRCSGEIVINAYKTDSTEVYCELGRFSVKDAD